MKKSCRMLFGLLAFTLVFSGGAVAYGKNAPLISPITASAESTYESLRYEVTENNEITITGCDSSAEVVVIPSEIDGLPVTYIQRSAFEGCTNLKSVIILSGSSPSIYIGEDAFKDCTCLKSVTIYDSVWMIGSGAFEGCENLESITIPDSVTSISGTFRGCTSLTSITIPDSVTSIGDGTFENCSNLKSVTIPDSVTSIGSYAFNGCKRLTSITIPDSVTSIKSSTFSRCTSLTSVTVPDSVESIGGYAFYNCTSLTSITIPDSVTHIEGYAFSECKSLTSITIPDSVTSIGSSAFAYCKSLESITILNPECKIYNSDIVLTIPSNSTIYGYENSTAQAYAEEYGCKFESLDTAPVKETIKGDTDGDDKITVTDAVNMAKFILGKETAFEKEVLDITGDGIVDSFDLCVIKKMILEK